MTAEKSILMQCQKAHEISCFFSALGAPGRPFRNKIRMKSEAFFDETRYRQAQNFS